MMIISPFELPPIQLHTLERSVAERLVLDVIQIVHHLLQSRVGSPDAGLLQRLPESLKEALGLEISGQNSKSDINEPNFEVKCMK